MHEIGVPGDLLADFGDCFCYIRELTEIAEGVWLVPHDSAGLEQIGARAGLFKMVDEELQPDDFAHELSVVFRTEEGLVVCNSCSHAGLVTIVEEVQAVFPGERIAAFLGGLHMKGRKDGQEICTFSAEEIEALAERLKEKQVGKIYTGHCTGGPGLALLRNCMGEQVEALTTGKVIEI